jgi:hypothetical protein
MKKFHLNKTLKDLIIDFKLGKITQTEFEKCVSLSSEITTSKASDKKVERTRADFEKYSPKRKLNKNSVSKEEVKMISRRGNILRPKDLEKGKLLGSFEVFELVLNTLLNKVGKRELIHKVDIGSAIKQFQTLHNNLITEHGIAFGTKKWKSIQMYCIQLLEGNLKPEHPERVATGRVDGWPRAINITRQLYFQVRDKGPYMKEADQIIRSLFAMNRVIEDFNELTLDSIEYKAKVDPKFLKEFDQFLDELFGKCAVKGEFKIEDGKYTSYLETNFGKIPYDYEIKPPLSTKASGPNKVPKAESAPYEAYLLARDIGSKELYPHLKEINRLTGNDNFADFIELNADMYSKKIKSVGKSVKNGEIHFNRPYKEDGIVLKDHWSCSPTVNETKSKTLRKITSVPDSGNKSRVVAIPDYWTQCALSPFEDNILNVIKVVYPLNSNIFDHKGGFIKLQNAIKTGTSSLDATSWTDTFSSKIQKKVVSKLFGTKFCNAWSGLVVHCNWNVKDTNQKVKYLTGQGMGTKGSFQIASLTYLLVMEFLTKKNYPKIYEERSKSRDFIDLFNQIGDDSWNQDPDGSIRKDLIELVGMPINETKSKFATNENLVGEYVSRNINYGKDVSRISLNLCRQVGKNIFFLPDLIAHLDERTESFDIGMLIGFLRLRVKLNGKPCYADHIWSSFYKALIVDNIINDDKIFYRLLVDLENSLSDFPEKENDLTILRTHFTETNRLDTLRFLLLLQDCEYMYSKILESFEFSNNLFGKYPFGKFTELFNGKYFLMTHVNRGIGLEELSALRAAYITKSLLSNSLFKLNLNTFRASKIHELNIILAGLQGELSSMIKDCVYGKSYENRKDTIYKHRIDRSYNIQKTYVNGNLLPNNLSSGILLCIPNIALLGDLSHDTFVEISSQFESSYPIHEDVMEKNNSSDPLCNSSKELHRHSSLASCQTGVRDGILNTEITLKKDNDVLNACSPDSNESRPDTL